MVALRLELRHSPSFLALPLLVLLAGLATERALVPGVSVGANVTTAVVGSIQLLGPVSAGLAAWFATRERRRDIRYLHALSARPRHVLVGVETLALFLPAALAMLAVAVFATVRQISQGMYGAVSLWGISAALCGLLLHVSLGYVVGLAWPRAAVAPVVTLVFYLFVVWNLDQAGRPFYLLSPVTVEQATVFYPWKEGLFLWQTMWLLGVSTLVLTVASWARDALRTLVAVGLVAALAAGVGAGQLVRFDGRFFALDDGATEQLSCTSQDPVTVCLHPAFIDGREELVEAFPPVMARLGPHAAPRLEQMRRGVEPRSEGTAAIHLDDLSPGFAQAAVAEYVGDLIDIAACSSTDRAFGVPLTRLVVDWLVSGDVQMSSYRELNPEPARALSRLNTVEEQKTWFDRHFDEFRTCRLTEASFA